MQSLSVKGEGPDIGTRRSPCANSHEDRFELSYLSGCPCSSFRGFPSGCRRSSGAAGIGCNVVASPDETRKYGLNCNYMLLSEEIFSG